MSPTPRRRRRPPPDPFPDRGLAELGLAVGDAVRFRRSDTERWKPATVARRERDGSVGLHDAKGASRAIPIHCIEVRDAGPRGGVVWEPLPERAARTEQLPLVAPPTPGRRRSGPAASTFPADEAGSDVGSTRPPADRPRHAADTTASVDESGPGADHDRGDEQLRLL